MPPSRAGRDLAVLALATLVAVLLLVGPWALQDPGGSLSPDLDDPTFVLWTLEWDLHQLPRDPLGLFQANMSWPARDPLARTETMLGALPVHALFRGLGAGPVAAGNLDLVAAFWLSALAMAWLVRSWTGHLGAAFLAGVAYAVAPLHLAEVGRLQLAQGYGFPLLFLAWDALRGRPGVRTALGLALAVATLFVSCIYFFLQALVAAPLYGLLTLFRSPRRGRILAALAGALVLAGLLLAPLLVPYARMQRQWPADRPLSFNAHYSADPANFLAVPPGNALWGKLLAPFASRRVPAEAALFPGLVLLLGAGLALGYRVPGTGPLLALAGLAALLALGPDFRPGGLPSLYGLLHEHLPGFAAHRVPARFGFLVDFALAGAAGLGLAAFLRALPARRARLAFGLLAALLALEGTCPMPRVPVPAPSAVYEALAREAPGVLLELPMFPDPDPSPSLEGLRLLASTRHWHVLVNGYPFVTPPVTHEIADATRFGPSHPAFGRLLQALGVRHLVLHTGQMGPAERASWSRLPSGFRLLTRDGTDELWSVPDRPLPTAGPEAARWSLLLPPALPAGARVTLGLEIRGGAVLAAREVPGCSPVEVSWQGPAAGPSRVEVVRPLLPTWVFPGDQHLRSLQVQVPGEPGDYRVRVRGAEWSWEGPVRVEAGALRYGLPEVLGVEGPRVPESVRPGEELRLEGRVENRGPAPLQAGTLAGLAGETWLYLRWVGPEGRVGGLERRPLRADLFPGQALPWVVRTRAPLQAGTWRVEVAFEGAEGPPGEGAWRGRSVRVGP